MVACLCNTSSLLRWTWRRCELGVYLLFLRWVLVILLSPQVDVARWRSRSSRRLLSESNVRISPGGRSLRSERAGQPALQDTCWPRTGDGGPAPSPVPAFPLSALALHRLRPPSSAIERDFALLTLTDGEQRELYEAARIIQTAFRRYKGRRLKEQQDMAAAVIQRCYRNTNRYKLNVLFQLRALQEMTQAAILIQSKFRSYYEQKRFQQSRRAAVLIQQYYRSYKEAGPREEETAVLPELQGGSFLTKKQDQAARKIMRFLRRCRHRIKELKQSRELERRGLTT
uniref:Calmodulin binding transcription activator 2 n=1 Tax=Neogobius melanostomus TaxID=47308 RepID=A0A8C6V2X3_9GOBI